MLFFSNRFFPFHCFFLAILFSLLFFLCVLSFFLSQYFFYHWGPLGIFSLRFTLLTQQPISFSSFPFNLFSQPFILYSWDPEYKWGIYSSDRVHLSAISYSYVTETWRVTGIGKKGVRCDEILCWYYIFTFLRSVSLKNNS